LKQVWSLDAEAAPHPRETETTRHEAVLVGNSLLAGVALIEESLDLFSRIRLDQSIRKAAENFTTAHSLRDGRFPKSNNEIFSAFLFHLGLSRSRNFNERL
jgi:hypothetical protein